MEKAISFIFIIAYCIALGFVIFAVINLIFTTSIIPVTQYREDQTRYGKTNLFEIVFNRDCLRVFVPKTYNWTISKYNEPLWVSEVDCAAGTRIGKSSRPSKNLGDKR